MPKKPSVDPRLTTPVVEEEVDLLINLIEDNTPQVEKEIPVVKEIPPRVSETLKLYRGSYNQYVHLARHYTEFNTRLLKHLPSLRPYKHMELPFFIEGKGPISLHDFVKYVFAEGKNNSEVDLLSHELLDLVFKNIKNLPNLVKYLTFNMAYVLCKDFEDKGE